MKEVDDDGYEDTEVRVSGASLEELMSREEESPCTSRMRCWQPGEVEVEDRWGISSEGCAPPITSGSSALEKSKSRQLHGSRRSLRRVGRRVFSCFRRSTISFTVPDLEPSTPPKSGPLTAPRKSASGANGVTFLHEATDHRHHGDDDDDLESDEPTSPVVNCMGQVRPKQRHCKKVEVARERVIDDTEMFRRTKSQAPPRSPPMVSKSMSCKWKQLLRSNSSSISPSNHPCGSEGEPEIDLGRFSSASASHSDPWASKPPDKTCMLMRRSNSGRSNDKLLQEQLDLRNAPGRVEDGSESEPVFSASHSDPWASKPPDKTCLLMRRNNSGRSNDNTRKLLQEQLDLRNAGHGKDGSESEPVFRVLPSLKTTRIESPKWLADEPLVNKRQGFRKTLKGSSTSHFSHIR